MLGLQSLGNESCRLSHELKKFCTAGITNKTLNVAVAIL